MFFIWPRRLPGRGVCVCLLRGTVLYAEIGGVVHCRIEAPQVVVLSQGKLRKERCENMDVER